MYVNRTIVNGDGTPIRAATQVGSLSTVLKVTGLLNNSEMDMTFVFLRGTQKIQRVVSLEMRENEVVTCSKT